MILKTLLLCCVSLVITGCAQTSRSTIAFGLNTAPVTLDPRFATDAVSYRITRLIYQSLVDFDAQFNVVPHLASWEKLARNHYRFKLGNKHRKFHDGSRLTTADIKATYESILKAENASPHRGSLQMIAAMDLLDDDTIDFQLSQPDPLFPGRLVIGILPKKLIDTKHNFSKQPIGSGPMRFSEWEDEARLTLIRNSDQQTLAFITLKDPTVRVLKLLRGEIDLVQSNLLPEMVKWLDEKEYIQVQRKPGNTFSYIGFNLEDAKTGNSTIRTAIAHAIDRDAIIKFVMGESARKAGALFSPDHWAGHPRLIGIEYNPAQAKKLLKQAGYDAATPLELSYKTSNDPFRLRLATIIQDQLKSVHIKVDIRSYDWGTFYGDIKSGRFQMYSLSWVGLKMPDIFRYVFHSTAIPPHGANRGRFMNARVDAIIEAAEIEPTLAKQAAYYRELQQILFDELPYIPLWYEDNVLAMRKNIQGYVLNTDGNFDSLAYTVRVDN